MLNAEFEHTSPRAHELRLFLPLLFICVTLTCPARFAFINSLKFLASYDLAGVLKQHRQELEGLFLKANSQAVLAQFACAKIQLENPKTKPHAEVKIFLHGEVNSQ